jgi:hypothetical protein
MSKRYDRPNPLISGQTTKEHKEILERINEIHGASVSSLVGEGIAIAIPKLLKRYPLNVGGKGNKSARPA